MDRKEAKAIMDEAQRALAPLFADHNLAAPIIRASYEAGRITLTIKGEGQGDNSPKVTDWAKYAVSFGLPVDALGKTITSGGRRWTIDGLVITRRKYPVSVTRDDGKAMLLTVKGVKQGLGLPINVWD